MDGGMKFKQNKIKGRRDKIQKRHGRWTKIKTQEKK